MVHMVMGDLLLRKHAHDDAVAWAQRAVVLNPNDAEARAALANVLSFMNRAGEAVGLMEEAFRLDPLHTTNFDMYMGRALLLGRRFDEALLPLRSCARRAPDYWPCHAFLAAAYGHLNQLPAARAALEELRRYAPVAIRTVADYLAPGDYLPGPGLETLNEGLVKAGLPPG